jgi:UDP-glucose 4-epimerase
MEKVLVTGGAGFIGSWVVDNLINKGYRVAVIDNLSKGNEKNINPKAKFYHADIINLNSVLKIFSEEKPKYVFHLAAQISVRDSMQNPEKNRQINIFGSRNILHGCIREKVKKFIFSSTGGAIYGKHSEIPTPETAKAKPKSEYGKSKLIIEKNLLEFKEIGSLDSVILRYSNVYGPRQNSEGEAGVISIFINKILSKNPITINGNGKQTRDFIYVKDVADANILAMNLSGIYNVGTGTKTSINKLFKKISYLCGPSEKRFGKLLEAEVKRSCLDSSKLIKEGWKPKYNLEDGLNETIEWFKKNR